MTRNTHSARGTVIAYFLILLSVLVTGLLTTMALVTGGESQVASMTLKRDQAFYAAEGGLQRGLWLYRQDSTWRASSTTPVTGVIGSGTTAYVYALTCVDHGAGGVEIVSTVAQPASPAYSQITAIVTPGSAAPGLAVGNNISDSGSLSITGTAQAKGSITRSGTMTLTTVSGMGPSNLQAMGSFTSSGTFSVPGDLQFNSSVTSSGNVTVGGDAQAGTSISHTGQWHITGSTQAFDSPDLQINTPTVDTASLIAEAQADGTVIGGGAKSNLTIDFTQGANHVVCINGNVTISGHTTVVGTGTLIVVGTMSLSGALGTQSSPIPMNVVTTSDATMSGTFNINGCLCVGGSFTKSGQMNINGIVVVQQNLTGSGNIAMTYQTPPSFVHYTGTGPGGSDGSGPQVLFVGPIFSH